MIDTLPVAGSRGTVVLIEDSPDEAELLSIALEQESFVPVACATAAEGMAACARSKPVAVILDWGLPDRPGVDICRELRAADPFLPIIFVSGRTDEATVSRALDAGADDFVTKPVRRTELIARVEAHLRKSSAVAARAKPVSLSELPDAESIRFGDVAIDISARQVIVSGSPVTLGPLEFKLLEYLVHNAGVAVSRNQIMTEVYGYDADISTERVDLLARRLRAKLGDGSARGGQLTAVAGYGYRWERRRAGDSVSG